MKPEYQIDDNDLLCRISTGDRAAFTLLYSRYIGNLTRFISSICFSKEISEEIVQDLFLKIWLDRENITAIGSIKPYLYKAAKNRLLNHLKKKQTEIKVLDTIGMAKASEGYGVEEELTYAEYYHIAQTAIDRLPVKRKEIFKLRHEQDLSLDEISQKLHISKSVVKKQLYTGIHFVKTYLSKYGEINILLVVLSFYRRS
jgi:RNA polymerase sigma-70 factor (family 1)